jgi:cholesterol transport system auxiliary component
MTVRSPRLACLVIIATCVLGGCVGKLLGGGKPDALYRFGGSACAADISLPETARQAIVLEPVRFAAEIEGNRMLAVSGTSARYIKGSRWVTSGPDLFAEALRRSFAAHAPGLRMTGQQGSERTGYSLMVRIERFEAQYDAPLMASPPTIVMESEATLYALSDRTVFAQRHFTARAPAGQNRVAALVAGFDQAATCTAADIAVWVTRATAHLPQAPEPACAPSF